MNAIEICGLIKRYGDITAVDNLSLTVKKGELFSLLGVNGAGKTTTIKLLTCISEASKGTALVGGFDINREPHKVKEIIGVSPQNTAVAQNLTVKENLELICGIYGLSKQKSFEKISELCDKFSLGTVLKRRAGKLSGGWQRRVSIAMALVCEPQILFLDEPTLGLDVISRRELWEIILSLKDSVTIILTTHYMQEAAALSDRIGIMKDGKLLAVGTLTELTALSDKSDLESAFVSIVTEGLK